MKEEMSTPIFNINDKVHKTRRREPGGVFVNFEFTTKIQTPNNV
jgi:hypothetical protein